MDGSFQHPEEWRKVKCSVRPEVKVVQIQSDESISKWQPPVEGYLKVNVDASVRDNAENFSIGMVIRDYQGAFIEGKVMCFSGPVTVFKAEAIGVREALSWVKLNRVNKVVVESDSLLTVRAVTGGNDNHLEVGHVIESCKRSLRSMPYASVVHVRKHANRVAHMIARMSCLVQCHEVFSSPPNYLLETLMYDVS